MSKSLKKILVLLCNVVLLAGCVHLEIIPVENLKVEYGDDLLQYEIFNKESSSEGLKVKSIEGYDSKKVGSQIVTVLFTDSNERKEEKIEIEVVVEDTKKPIIILNRENIEVTEGDELDLKKIVKEVTDPVDGEISFSDKETVNSGWYFDTTELDIETPGTYNIKVVAIDKNKNTSEKEIFVKVNEVVVEQPIVDDYNPEDLNNQQVIVDQPKEDNNEDDSVQKDDDNEIIVNTGNFSNASLQQQATQIINSILTENMSDVDRLYTIYKWVESNIYYDGNFAKSDWESMADVALKRRRGNCYAYYAASRALLTAAGYQSDVASFPGDTHMWNLVYYNGAWLHFDTTTGWGGDRFLLTDEQLRAYRYDDLYYVW